VCTYQPSRYHVSPASWSRPAFTSASTAAQSTCARYRAAGVNHQAWLLEWEHEGRDLYPLLRERIAADPELERRVRVEIFRRIGGEQALIDAFFADAIPFHLFTSEFLELARSRLNPGGVWLAGFLIDASPNAQHGE
jgi:hypothetical protein